MLVSADGKGVPAGIAGAPAVCGVESVAVDPRDPKVVYLAFSGARAGSLAKQYPSIPGSIYKSTDGGVTFTGSDLAIDMEPNGRWRTYGERLQVDPLNSRVLFYGSVKQGVFRSADGGKSWKPVAGGGAPAANDNVLAIHHATAAGTVQRDGLVVCKDLYQRSGEIFMPC